MVWVPSDHRPKGVQRPVCPPMNRHGFWRRRARSPAAGPSWAPSLVTNGSFPQTPGSLRKTVSSSLTKGKPVFTAGSGEVRRSGAGLPKQTSLQPAHGLLGHPAGHVSRTWPPYCASLIRLFLFVLRASWKPKLSYSSPNPQHGTENQPLGGLGGLE